MPASVCASEKNFTPFLRKPSPHEHETFSSDSSSLSGTKKTLAICSRMMKKKLITILIGQSTPEGVSCSQRRPKPPAAGGFFLVFFACIRRILRLSVFPPSACCSSIMLRLMSSGFSPRAIRTAAERIVLNSSTNFPTSSTSIESRPIQSHPCSTNPICFRTNQSKGGSANISEKKKICF